MAKTTQNSITTTPTPVICQVPTLQITVGEDPSVVGFPTTDFRVRKPSSADQPRRLQAGSTYTFFKGRAVTPGALFRPGDIVGYIETVSGTTTFFQDEVGI